MSRNDEMKELLASTNVSLSKSLKMAMWAFIAIGALSFLAGLFMGSAEAVWQSLLINTLFFAGVSHAGLMYSVIYTITNANWGRPFKRFGEAMASFIPVSWLLFAVLFFGGDYFFEWADHAKVIHSKEGWLNFSFFVKRNIVMILLVGVLSLYFMKLSFQPDIALAKKLNPSFGNKFADRLVEKYDDSEAGLEKNLLTSKRLAPLLGFLYGLLCSLIAFDWMMSIDQEWFSTMFGVQYMVANLTGASAALMIIGGFVRQKFDVAARYLSLDRYHDMSKFTFALCLLWTYMIFSQVIVIWYANLAEETPYLILRMQSEEWGWMFTFIAILLFGIPFWGLMSKTACRSVVFSRLVAIDILVGIWFEKYFLIVPSMQENAIDKAASGAHHAMGFHFNAFDITLALGLFGAFMLCFFYVLERVPALPISDRFLFKKGH